MPLPAQSVDATLALNLPDAGLLGNKGKMTAYLTPVRSFERLPLSASDFTTPPSLPL
jgi:hypothetical protein